MYCKNCKVYNEDGSKECFACGRPLESDINEDVNEKKTVQKPSVPQQYSPLFVEYSSTRPVVSIVLSFLNFNIIGVVLSILSLVKYNKYIRLLLQGEQEKAEAFGKSSKKLSKAALIITILLMIIRPIILVAGVLVGADTAGILGEGGLLSAQEEAQKAMISLLTV